MTSQYKEISTVREKLFQANIFLEVSNEAIESANLTHFLEGIPKKFVDINKIGN